MMPPVKKAAPRAVVKLEIINALFSFASFSFEVVISKNNARESVVGG